MRSGLLSAVWAWHPKGPSPPQPLPVQAIHWQVRWGRSGPGAAVCQIWPFDRRFPGRNNSLEPIKFTDSINPAATIAGLRYPGRNGSLEITSSPAGPGDPGSLGAWAAQQRRGVCPGGLHGLISAGTERSGGRTQCKEIRTPTRRQDGGGARTARTESAPGQQGLSQYKGRKDGVSARTARAEYKDWISVPEQRPGGRRLRCAGGPLSGCLLASCPMLRGRLAVLCRT